MSEQTTGDSALRIGLLSFAHTHALTYARLLKSWPDVELLVADPDAAADTPGELRGEELARQLGVNMVASYDQLFDWGPHAVVLCSETSRHRRLVERAAAAGVHVLCEKPLATTLSDAYAMIQACAVTGARLTVAHPVRFHPAFRVLRERVRSGALGRLLAASGTNNAQSPNSVRRWFVDAELAGGGALMDRAEHLADLLDALHPSPAKEVFAQTNSIIHGGEVEVETGGLVMVTYADGLVATIDCSWSAPRTYPAQGGLTLSLDGELGSAAFDELADRMDLFDDAASTMTWLAFGPDLDSLMLSAFLESVRSGTHGEPDGEVGFRTLQIVMAAYESARTGQPVQLT